MINIKKNPETVGKLKVGTTGATPADGELSGSGAATLNGLVTCNNDLVLNDATGLASIKLQGGAAGAVNFELMQGITGVANAGFSIYDTTNSAIRLAISGAGDTSFNGDALPWTNWGKNLGSPSVQWNKVYADSGNFAGVNVSGLSASADVQTDGSKNLTTSSDKRLKNDIGELTAGLDIINNLKPHYFSWKSDKSNAQQLGFFAQDVYEFLPEAAPREQKQNLVTPAVAAETATFYVEGDELPDGKAVGDEKKPAVEAVEAVFEPATNDDGSPDYNWGFNGRPIIAALVAAVKELKAKVEALEGAAE